MKKLLLLFVGLTSMALNNAMEKEESTDEIDRYRLAEPPRKTSYGWISKIKNSRFTEYCREMDNHKWGDLKAYYMHYKIDGNYYHREAPFPPMEYSMRGPFPDGEKQLFLMIEKEYNEATQLPTIELNGKTMLCVDKPYEIVKTPLGFITKKITELHPVPDAWADKEYKICFAITDENGTPTDRKFEAYFDTDTREYTFIGSDKTEIEAQFNQLQTAHKDYMYKSDKEVLRDIIRSQRIIVDIDSDTQIIKVDYQAFPPPFFRPFIIYKLIERKNNKSTEITYETEPQRYSGIIGKARLGPQIMQIMNDNKAKTTFEEFETQFNAIHNNNK